MKNYKETYSKIINNNNLTFEQKRTLIEKLVQNIDSELKRADKRVEFNKKLDKIDVDKVALVEMVIGSLFPVMGSTIITWGLVSAGNRELYNKLVDILMGPVLYASAIGMFAGATTTIFEETVKKELKANLNKRSNEKLELESVKKEIEGSINLDELEM